MRNKGLVVVITLTSLLLLAGLGAYLMMDSGKAKPDRPTIPQSRR